MCERNKNKSGQIIIHVWIFDLYNMVLLDWIFDRMIHGLDLRIQYQILRSYQILIRPSYPNPKGPFDPDLKILSWFLGSWHHCFKLSIAYNFVTTNLLLQYNDRTLLYIYTLIYNIGLVSHEMLNCLHQSDRIIAIQSHSTGVNSVSGSQFRIRQFKF